MNKLQLTRKRFQLLVRSLCTWKSLICHEGARISSSLVCKILEKKPSLFAKIFLFIPAVVGWLAHAPLYVPIKNFTHKKTVNNDHYDAILVALLLFVYPVCVILLALILVMLTNDPVFWLLIILLPFTAWAYVQLKPQLDKQPILSWCRIRPPNRRHYTSHFPFKVTNFVV